MNIKELDKIKGKGKYQCTVLFHDKNGIDYGCMLYQKHKGKHIRCVDLGLNFRKSGKIIKNRSEKYNFFEESNVIRKAIESAPSQRYKEI